MIKLTAILMAVYAVVGAVAGYFCVSPEFGWSLFAGGLFMLGNLAGLNLGWRLIFSKKSIALAVLVIIFKYVVLGLFLWSLILVRGFSLTAFVLGLGSLIFAILGSALFKAFVKNDLD